ncbi:hypothetical protein MB02_11835 [Croceicoccus estronivorus]|uniref:FAD-dependent oxidoreductase n=1 Tax=Croceicoccus estronivorus TaxID=1172626 RepID=UPI00082D6C0F|nr:FAD-dependent oxidoreductase [Croceicoccus estronivorus]OCC23319.1 hypothetical protein MB02_11835 [Croceicoccus estronivorus]
MSEQMYDVMVIGGGGAGMAAAITAADTGASVCLIEASDRLGGSTALAGGLLFAGGSRQQRALGIDDGPEAMFRDVMAINPDAPEPVIRRLCAEAANSLAWLEALGVEYPEERLSSPSGRTVPRAHEPVGFGMAVAERLDNALYQRHVDIALKSRVEQLVCDAAGRVTGALVDGEVIHARAVVIATGGIGANPELVQRFLPKTRGSSDWVWHVGWPSNRGDGLLMGEEVGAKLGGADSGLLLMTPGFHRDFEVIGPEWGVLVNCHGQRFVAEDGGYWEIAEGLERQDGSRGWVIFDAAMLREHARPHPRVLEALANGTITLSWITETLERQIAEGKVHRAGSLAELAEKAGVNPAGLEAGIAHYNKLADAGHDDDFGKMAQNLVAVRDADFYAAEVRPAILVVTGAGLCIDERARVLSEAGTPIPGLFAAGETVGNVFGRNYVGSGYAIANCITYGRIAGAEAVAAS